MVPVTAAYNREMLEVIAFDSLSFVKRLTASGFTEAQAEGLAHEQVNLLHSNLATKADLEALRLANQVEIEKLRETTRADLASAKVEIVKWMVGALAAQGALIVTLIKLT